MPVFKYDVSIADLEAFWDAELMSGSRRAVTIPRLAFAYAGGFLAYALVRRWLHDPIMVGAVVAIVALAMFMGTGEFIRKLHRRAIRRKYLEAPDTDLGPVTLSVGPDHFEVAGTSTQSRNAWSAVRKLAVTPTHAFIYLGPWKAVTVPLDQLQASSRAELVTLLKAYVPTGAAVA